VLESREIDKKFTINTQLSINKHDKTITHEK
jgi:hypothetical protein